MEKLNKINFHSFFEICTILSGLHFLAQFISLCVYAIRVSSTDYYGQVSGLSLIGNIIYSALPTFFTFVILLGITVLYFNLVPKKEKEISKDEINDTIDKVQEQEEQLLEEIKQEVNPLPKYSMRMKKDELLEIAESMGLKIDKSVKKEEIIKALNNLK